MPTTLKIVSGNTAPDWVITCERDNVAIDLTGASVALIIAKGTTITQANGTATLTTPAAGIITYSPQATDTPSSGTYKVDVKITYPNLKIERLYEQLKVKARKPIS